MHYDNLSDGLGTHLFVKVAYLDQETAIWVKLSPVTTSLTTQR